MRERNQIEEKIRDITNELEESLILKICPKTSTELIKATFIKSDLDIKKKINDVKNTIKFLQEKQIEEIDKAKEMVKVLASNKPISISVKSGKRPVVKLPDVENVFLEDKDNEQIKLYDEMKEMQIFEEPFYYAYIESLEWILGVKPS